MYSLNPGRRALPLPVSSTKGAGELVTSVSAAGISCGWHQCGWHQCAGTSSMCLLVLTRVVMTAVLLLLLNASPARSLGLPGEPAVQSGSGQMALQSDGSDSARPAPMQHSKVHFAISGMLAVVTLEQTFLHVGDDWVEGVYTFPLPDRAAVRRMEIKVGERRIVGSIRERTEAAEIYRQALHAGKKASLVSQQRPNLFSNRIANIGPGEQITVQLEYVQPLDYQAGAFSLRFPMTLTPRYIPGVPLLDSRADNLDPMTVGPLHGWGLATDQVPDAAAISPPQHMNPGSAAAPLNPIEISATLDPGMPLASVEASYHEITLARSSGVYRVELSNGPSEMDRDFVLRWVPVVGAQPQAAVFSESVAGQRYAMLMLMPPQPVALSGDERDSGPPREIIFVIDTSGSMGGVSIEQARSSLELALRQLETTDHFNIIAFDQRVKPLHRAPVPATRHYVASAREFVRQLQAGGGTEMLPALSRALLGPARETPAGRLRQIVFITDGAVGNEVALYRAIEQGLGDTRLFTVGIGSAPNSWFMRKAAEFGRGSYTAIGDLAEVAEKMSDLFEQIASPMVTDIQVRWPQSDEVEIWPKRIPDLYAGDPLVITAKLPESTTAVTDVIISGRSAGEPWSTRLQIEADVSVAEHDGVASLWARRKVAALLDLKATGHSDEAVRARVLPVALTHQLLSPYTSFVAVEQQVSRPSDESWRSRPVPNTRPQGQIMQAVGYPATATTGPARAYLGLLLSFLALLTYVLRQPEVDRDPIRRD